MTDVAVRYAIFAAVFTAATAIIYIRAWRASWECDRTPTGFGVLLSFVLFGSALNSASPADLQVALGLMAMGAALYWFDDAIELRARVRITISLIAGAAAGAAFLFNTEGIELASAIGICIVAAFVQVALTNMVNFYDGADLNLATFVALTAGLILAYAPHHPQWAPLALACLAFVIIFAAFNRRPRTIYLGDSGSFAFAGLLTVMAISFLVDRSSLPPEAAIPAALPALDVFYVLSVRIAAKHDLLTRNYLHLYQQLSLRFSGFGYLLPQIANAGLCLAAAAILQLAGLSRLSAVIAAMIVVTLPFYFACRRVLIPGDSVVESQPSR